MSSKNPYQNLRMEFHILQSFPVTCLNRDDVGAPKSAVVGGVTRARVSSQCWKRQVRLALHEFGVTLGSRTKLISKLVQNACLSEGASEEQAQACGNKIEQVFIKKAEPKKGAKLEEDSTGEEHEEKDKSDTLLFLSAGEVSILSKAFKEKNFHPDEVITQSKPDKQATEIAKLIGKPNYSMDGLDIALFGRMVAQAATLNVEGSSSFSHAISTHKVTNEVEFFTALDDNSEEPGSAHMGSLEFNSATYYRYIGLDLGQLFQNLGGDEFFIQAIEAFVKALYLAVPSARQTTQSGASPWEFAKVFVRKGQGLQVPFETPVQKDREGGFLKNSKIELKRYLSDKEKLSGSLFQKLGDFEWGDNTEYSMDKLISDLQKSVVAGKS